MEPADELFSDPSEISRKYIWDAIKHIDSKLPVEQSSTTSAFQGELLKLLEQEAIQLKEQPNIYHLLTRVLQSQHSVSRLKKWLDVGRFRWQAVILLGWLGEKAKSALPDLFGIASANSGAPELAKIAAMRISFSPDELLAQMKTYLELGDDGETRQLSDLMIRAGYSKYPEFLKLISSLEDSGNPSLQEVARDIRERLSL